MIHQYKVESQERIKKWERERERERERITTFSRENNKKIVENNVRKKKVKIKNIVINTKLPRSCYVMW